MGTSSAYGGPGGGTPLVPSWLDGDPTLTLPGVAQPAPIVPGKPIEPGAPPPLPPIPGTTPLPLLPPSVGPVAAPPLPAAAPSRRFSTTRSNYRRFAGSGGQDRRSLRRAARSYVSRASGGSKRAAQRMGSSRAGGAALANFLADVANRGAGPALRALNLAALAGQPIEEIFIGLADYVCPADGSVDAGVARDAFIETIADLAENGITDLDTLTAEQTRVVFELYATHAIEARLCNDIGANVVTVPADAKEAETLERQLGEFIRGAVSDAVDAVGTAIAELTPDRVLGFVTGVYEQAFEVLQAMADEGDES